MTVRTGIWSDATEMIREQASTRELLTSLIRRDLIVRYKQAVLGVGWAVLSPLLHMFAFAFLFTRVVELDTPYPYPIFAYVGLLPWHMFASALRSATSSLTDNAALVTRVYFPREVFPFAAVAVAAVDFAVASTVLVGLMIYYGIGVGPSLFFVPIIVLIQLILTTGLALLLSMANLFFRDIKYLFEVLIGVGLFVTAVAYPIGAVGGRVGILLGWNPMTRIIQAYRATILAGQPPEWGPLIATSAASLALLFCGWIWFHRVEPLFAERI